MDQEQLQQLIGPDYRLQWVIGHGGMSTVWLADDLSADREVAIKFLRPEFSNNREFLDRFRNEATAAETIHSVNVVETYEYRELEGPGGQPFCFIAMEYVQGESLADLIEREGIIPEDQALDFLEQAASGLAAIHQRGFIHRDIKPGNLLLTANGTIKITDFGIAKAAAAVPLTRTGMVVGTAQYVSPEQAQGLEVSSSSDVYSLGVVGYEMLTGRRPFQGDSSVSVAIAHINEAPPSMGTHISAQTRELINIMLRKDPRRRYATGGELAQAISAVRFGQRPPQPSAASAVTEVIEPSADAATALLQNRNQNQPTPSGVQPTALMGAGTTNQTGMMPQQPVQQAYSQPQTVVQPRRNRQPLIWWIIGVLIALVLIVGTIVYMRSSDSSSSSTTPTTSSVEQSPTTYRTWEETTPTRRGTPTIPFSIPSLPPSPMEESEESSDSSTTTEVATTVISTVTETTSVATSATSTTRTSSASTTRSTEPTTATSASRTTAPSSRDQLLTHAPTEVQSNNDAGR